MKISDCGKEADYSLYRQFFKGKKKTFYAEPIGEHLFIKMLHGMKGMGRIIYFLGDLYVFKDKRGIEGRKYFIP